MSSNDRMRALRNWRLLLGMGFLLLARTAASVAAGFPANAEELLKTLAIEDGSALAKAEIVSYDVEEPTEKSLAAGLAMYLEAPWERVTALVEQGIMIADDPDLLAIGTIPPSADPEAFSGVVFTEEQAHEAERLLSVGPGSEFNLSDSEIAGFRELQTTLGSGAGEALREGVAKQYRKLLRERFQAYRNAGLSGIASYAREGGQAVDVGAELRVFTQHSEELARFFPELQAALLKYPAAMPADAVSVFRWVNRKTEGRPTFTLTHRLLLRSGSGAAFVLREYYVGHSYNCSQLTLGIAPFQSGSLVFYSHRVSTDQVAGLAGGLRHAIGRKQLRDTMLARMERLRSALQGGRR
ncbi:MAG TPA: hypothetical protein VNL74_04950 [Methylococcus sp.]|nr:hypothetical protein [Methylococcus sp.]